VPEVERLERLEVLERRLGDARDERVAHVPARTVPLQYRQRLVKGVDARVGEHLAGSDLSASNQPFERLAVHVALSVATTVATRDCDETGVSRSRATIDPQSEHIHAIEACNASICNELKVHAQIEEETRINLKEMT
jgi:hypothetical protein